jgi:2'-5' RNA ligase
MRLFFAVPAGKRISGLAWKAIQDSGIRRAPWRWIRPENYHFTVKFLGDVPEESLPALHEAARRSASLARPFRLSMGGIGAFPDLDRPRVIYYGIDSGFGQLRDLAGLIEDECEKIGFARERRRFRAHLTLARVKKPVPREVLDILRGFPHLGTAAFVDVGSFVLMSSTLTSSGAIYQETGCFELER